MMDSTLARIARLESVAETTSEHLAVIEQDVAVIRPNYATKADIAASEATLLKWMIGTAITLASLAFAAAKVIN